MITDSIILSKSSIQKSEINELFTDWFSKNVKSTKCLYRGSCDGWEAADFHRLCDN